MKIPEKMTNNSSKYSNDIHTIQKGEGFELTLSMDCEGTNYDKNMQENVRHLEKFLQQATENGITTILFVTALFARELKKQNLLPHLQNNYRVIFGLHIHPENLPQDIAQKLDFLREGEEYLANYTLEEQRQIIAHVIKDLKESGVSELQIFRGGQFSMNDDTVKILLEDTNISAESHNPFREQYNIEAGKLRSIPVYAKSREVEMRLEFFETQDLVQMAKEAKAKGEKMLAITHSYMLDPKDFHYERDEIVDDIHKRLEKIIEAVK